MRELGIDPKTQLISIYRNPYSYEIHSGSAREGSRTDIQYEEWESQGSIDIPPMLSLEATEVVVVDTEEGMTQLIAVLKSCRFISVSVIQHRYRSYLGYSSIIMVRLM